LSPAAIDVSRYAPGFNVVINGEELEAEVSKIISNLTIEQEINKCNNFRFTVQDELKGGKFKWLGHDLFKFGNEILIKMGYSNNKRKMLEGKIQKISANFFQGLAPTFTVEGMDSAYKFLMEKSDSETFREKKNSDIVKVIAEEAHLKPKIDDTEQVYPIKRKKGGETYFEFIGRLAKESNNFEFYISDGKLFFIKPKTEKEEDPVLTLRWAHELISFQPTLNTSEPFTEVIVRSWDRTGKKTIEASAKAGEEEKQESGKKTSSQIAREIYGDVVKVITEKPVRSVEEAKEVALAELKEASDNFMKGQGETIGVPEITPGALIEIEGLGEWFSGTYYVEKTTHTIDSSGYRTSFNVRRNTI
jgi:phage protein D